MDRDRVALERHFEAEMQRISQRARKELGHVSARFDQMVKKHGGLSVAKKLLQPMSEKALPQSMKMFAAWGRLDLTAEFLTLRPEFKELFTPDELAVARDRLCALLMKER